MPLEDFMTQLDPLARAWLSTAMSQMQGGLDNYDKAITSADLAGNAATLGARQADGQVAAAEAAGPRPNVPMADFMQRLFGGVSSAIAPQLGGVQTAERNIDSEEQQNKQAHLIKLQRLERLQEKMIARAEKMGDTESALKLAKDQYKTSTESANLREAAVLTQNAAAERRRALEANRSYANQVVQQRWDAMKTTYGAAQQDYLRAREGLVTLQARGKNAKGKDMVPKDQRDAAQLEINRSYRRMRDAEWEMQAFKAATIDGNFNSARWKELPHTDEEAERMYGPANAVAFVSEWLQSNPGGQTTFNDLFSRLNKMHIESQGVPLSSLASRQLKDAWTQAQSVRMQAAHPEQGMPGPWSGLQTVTNPTPLPPPFDTVPAPVMPPLLQRRLAGLSEAGRRGF